MRFFSWAVFAVFTLFCVIIAVSNQDMVHFSLSPFPVELEMPVYLLVFLAQAAAPKLRN